MQGVARRAGKVQVQALPLPIHGHAFDGLATVGQQVVRQVPGAVSRQMPGQQVAQRPAEVDHMPLMVKLHMEANVLHHQAVGGGQLG